MSKSIETFYPKVGKKTFLKDGRRKVNLNLSASQGSMEEEEISRNVFQSLLQEDFEQKNTNGSTINLNENTMGVQINHQEVLPLS